MSLLQEQLEAAFQTDDAARADFEKWETKQRARVEKSGAPGLVYKRNDNALVETPAEQSPSADAAEPPPFSKTQMDVIALAMSMSRKIERQYVRKYVAEQIKKLLDGDGEKVVAEKFGHTRVQAWPGKRNDVA